MIAAFITVIPPFTSWQIAAGLIVAFVGGYLLRDWRKL